MSECLAGRSLVRLSSMTHCRDSSCGLTQDLADTDGASNLLRVSLVQLGNIMLPLGLDSNLQQASTPPPSTRYLLLLLTFLAPKRSVMRRGHGKGVLDRPFATSASRFARPLLREGIHWR